MPGVLPFTVSLLPGMACASSRSPLHPILEVVQAPARWQAVGCAVALAQRRYERHLERVRRIGGADAAAPAAVKQTRVLILRQVPPLIQTHPNLEPGPSGRALVYPVVNRCPRMVGPFSRLAIGLTTVVQFPQQVRYHALACLEALRGQCLDQVTQTAAHPA